MSISPPPIDAELAAPLSLFLGAVRRLAPDDIVSVREADVITNTDAVLDEAGLEIEDFAIAGHDGAEVLLSVVRSKTNDRASARPVLYFAHGGGMMLGNRRTGIDALFGWIQRYDAVLITVDYRLAPEFPDPTPIEDSYAGLVWTTEHAAELGIDPSRLLLVGKSAGGGLMAGTALLARDRGGPEILGQLLMYPLLDDRDSTASTLQFEDGVPWIRQENRTAWSALLGNRAGTDDVSIYAAPARATDLTNLPAAYIECGSCDIFRDESVAYATAIWAAGGDAELHIWPGGYHGYEKYAPQALLTQHTLIARDNWVARMLAPAEPLPTRVDSDRRADGALVQPANPH